MSALLPSVDETLAVASEATLATVAATEAVPAPPDPHHKRLRKLELSRSVIMLIAASVTLASAILIAVRHHAAQPGTTVTELNTTVIGLGPVLSQEALAPTNTVVAPKSEAEMKLTNFLLAKTAAKKKPCAPGLICVPKTLGKPERDPNNPKRTRLRATLQFVGAYQDTQGHLSDLDGKPVKSARQAVCIREATLFFEDDKLADFQNLL